MAENLEYYKVFYYAAKHLSLTEAAGILAVSQPAVSQSLKQLEAQLGTTLFVRASRGIRLTAEGELLYRYVSQGYELIEQGEQKLAQMQDLELGEIRIGASDMTLQFYLLPILERFHERYPGIKVSVSNAPTPETLKMLQNGDIDFGVVSTPFSGGEQLRIREVREIEDIYVAARRFIQYKNRMLDLKDLEKMPLIFLEGETSSRAFMEQFLAKQNVNVTPEFELATSDMIVQFALRNLGVGCVMRDFAEPYLEQGVLFALRFNKLIPKRKICVVTDPKGIPSAAASAMLELIEGNKGQKE